MENEFQILNNIENNNNATQRDIARNTGMSLGNVNLLIKRLVKKGLLKIEKLNTRSIRYILTPQGIKEKADATYNYVLISYRFINKMNSQIDKLIHSQLKSGVKQVFLYGQKDEICELLQNKLVNDKVAFKYIEILDEVNKEIRNFNKDEYVIVVWHSNFSDKLDESNIGYVNLLDIV